MLKKRMYLLITTVLEWVRRVALVLTAILLGCFLYGWLVEPNWIEVVPIQLTLPRLTPEFNGFKVVQISDLHVSRYMTQKRLDKIVTLINEQKPDVVALTGDFDSKRAWFKPSMLVEELSKINPQESTFAVLGNHDHFRNKQVAVRKALADSNVRELDNQVYTFQRGEEKLSFAGLDDPYVGMPDLKHLLQRLPQDGAVIILVHEPDIADRLAKTHRFDLQLSGHSHGGQISIPFLGPVVLPPGGQKYILGQTQVQDLWEYTNRGVGMTSIPIRFNSRPEITVFTLNTPS